jgi:hypothetical protein
VFGLNGARVYGVHVPEQQRKTEADPIGTRKQLFETYGPKTHFEYEALMLERGNLPV